jgi:Enoyl-CoA hydratase/isomerase
MAIPKLNDKGRMAGIPLSPEAKITVERRGEIVLIEVNRPQISNRFDPEAFFGLAKAYYGFDNDPSLRAAVFFGHGKNFSRGIDVDAFASLAKTGKPFAIEDGMLDPFARTQQLSKPLIAVVHGDTWNMGHELHLVADIRVASADVRFGQDENTHGRFPGGGSTIRFPREAGWGKGPRAGTPGIERGVGALDEGDPPEKRTVGNNLADIQRLSDQVSDNRHRQRWTPADAHGRSIACHTCYGAGSPHRYLAWGRRGRRFKSGHPDQVKGNSRSSQVAFLMYCGQREPSGSTVRSAPRLIRLDIPTRNVARVD